MQGKYCVKGMSFHAFHGFLEVERELGQVFSIDVCLSFPLKLEDASPSAIQNVRGADIYELTKGVVMGTKYKSHLSLALSIAKTMFDHFKEAIDASVVVGRRQLFIAGNVDQILAEVECRREDFIK